MAIGCSQGYHAYLKNQQCIKNKEFCKVMRYGQKIGEGQRYWQGSWNNGAWGSCEADLCKNYYKLIKKKCEPNYPKKEACKAHKYYNSAKLVLGLSDKEWCGDIEGRFKFINSGDDYIYDSLLKGFWSKKHNNLVTWAEAKKHCNSFKTKNWKMADIWQLNSLFSSLFDLNQGYISGLFADNLSGAFWSSTSCVFGSCSATTDGVWRLNFFSGVLSDSVAGIHFSHSVAKASEVRCFRPLSIAETPPK